MHGPLRRLATALLILFLAPTLSIASKPDPSIATEPTDPAAIQRYGPAYRYPRAGWIVVHIEGKPYERGYQHGRLLAPEIADYVKTLATKRSQSAPADAWREVRTMVNALFLRRYDTEYLEEMKGIADGAAAAGATFHGRALDLLDIVTVNSDIELEFLDAALDATPNGLEGQTFRAPIETTPTPTPPEHCSAFAANGPATADGKIVFGHITMFSLTFVRHFNIWLDVKPEKGHRVLMQTYPGGIQSGMDYYLNDAGMIVAETTIKQTHFDVGGTALASRIRKALQYADSIDAAVAILKTANNGMYTNEWLLADTKTNEIAMFELGTHRSKFWRSSNDEWFGGTKGFYWGCNNAKDLDVRLETIASTDGRPANLVYHPSDRDRAWLRLYEKHKGTIATGFGFEAFTTPPLAAAPSLDAKFTTTDLARDLKTWALFGPPLGRTWEPSDAERKKYSEVQPLVGNDWTILSAEDPSPDKSARHAEPKIAAVDLHNPSAEKDRSEETETPTLPHVAAWHGTILAKSDADTWLAAAFADYEPIVARENALKKAAREKKRELTKTETDEIALANFVPYTHYRAAVARLGKETPLAETKVEMTSDEWYQIAAGKGVLLLAALRSQMGDETFVKLMDDFGKAHAGQAVSTDEFVNATRRFAEEYAGFFKIWLTETGLPKGPKSHSWSVDSFLVEPTRAVIVYGTLKESDAQQEAATRLQRQIERSWSNVLVPILSDKEATRDALKGRHILIVGRPDTNSVAATLAKSFPVTFGASSFAVRGETFAHPRTALIAAGPNPDDPRSEVVIFAGLGGEATWRCVSVAGDRSRPCPRRSCSSPPARKSADSSWESPRKRPRKPPSID